MSTIILFCKEPVIDDTTGICMALRRDGISTGSMTVSSP